MKRRELSSTLVDVHKTTTSTETKTDHSVSGRIQGVILADPDIVARMELRTALTNDDPARVDGLTAVHLHAEALGIGVTPVACRAAALGLRHGSALGDVGYLDGGVTLTMSPPSTLVGLVLVGESSDLLTLDLTKNTRRNTGPRQLVRRGENILVVYDKNGIERDFFTFIGSEEFDGHYLACLYLLLLAAGGDDCIHTMSKPSG
jgi:hypothetical protein